MNTGDWTEVSVDLPVGWQELVAEVLAGGPSTSVAFEDLGDRQRVSTYLPEDEDTPARRDRIRAAIADLARTVPELGDARVTFSKLERSDFIAAWKNSCRAFRLGRRLVIAPTWWNGPVEEHEVRLTIEPGGSFGSGRHATTRACLRALAGRVRGGERMLDAGSGSGILCVAAALLGAKQTVGFDIDPLSKTYGEALAEANGTSERCIFHEGGFEVLTTIEGEFDILCANIYADVLIAELKPLAKRLAPSGWYALSGIHQTHLEEVQAAVVNAGLAIEERSRRGPWCTLIGGHAG